MHASTHTIVVTDVARPADLLRCVTQVRRTVPRSTEVVVVSGRHRPLPPSLARGVRTVSATSGDAFSAAVTTEAERDRLVVVARSDCRFSAGWFEVVAARSGMDPHTVGSLGGADPHLLVFPEWVRSTEAAQQAWSPVPGIDLVRRSASSVTRRPATISASLIVKDEEAVIGACLQALDGVVDEVVVYDTGSTDRTVEIAEQHGATVVRGYWNDHFGDARNRALEHSTTEWVFHVDADEVFSGDPAALRERLATETADLLRVVVVSTSWQGASEGEESRPVRLFRRELFEWTGALHEYVLPRAGVGGVVLSADPADVRLLHSGYHRATFAEKSKDVRNVDIARAAIERLEADDPQASVVWSNYGRALASAGRGTEALEAFERLFAPDGNPTAVVAGARSAVGVLVAQERWGEVDRWLTLLEEHGEAPGNLAVTRAQRHLAQEDVEAAERALRAVGDGLDTWGAPHDRRAVARLRVRTALARGHIDQALALLHAEAESHPETVDLGLLLRTTRDAGLPLDQLGTAAPEALVARSLREAFGLTGDLGLQWFEALHTARPDDVRVLVAGSVAAGRSDLQTALTWSVRVREAGHPELCALRRYAGGADRRPADAALAWAVLADAFGEFEALAQYSHALRNVSPADVPGLRAALELLAPTLTQALDESRLVASRSER